MKQTLMDLMSAMMPAMMPLFWAGAFLAGLSVMLLVLRQARSARWAAVVTVALGAFFLGSQAMGAVLGTQPSINFGDPSKFQFILVPFWQIGLAMAIPGAIVWILSRSRMVAAQAS